MARNIVSPVLFDISADIAGEIPIDLIKQWANSDLTRKSHSELISPFMVSGTVVCSDSAGLSKLSGERGLIEVMKLVSEPKDVIHKYGIAAKGKPIGVWFADNTEMLYPKNINVDELVEHLISAQLEISELTVQVGMSVHSGDFIELGSGLYGKDADYAEEIAESFTSGGEIVMTNSAKKGLTSKKQLVKREDLEKSYGRIYSVDYKGYEKLNLETKTQTYPLPFSLDFYNDLKSADLDKVEDKYVEDQIVILAKVDYQHDRLFLNNLSFAALASYYFQKEIDSYPEIQLVKANGQLAIYVTKDIIAAIEFSKKIQGLLTQNNFQSKIGISSGGVLLFDLPNGGNEIAGNPVNIASKFAEDVGDFGSIYIHDSITLPQK